MPKLTTPYFPARNIWRLLLGSCVSLVLAWLLLTILTGDRFRMVRLVGYFQPWLLLVLLPGTVLALFGRRRLLALALAGPALLIGSNYFPLFLPRSGTAPELVGEVRVLSYSINGWNRELGKIVEVIGRERPDILVEQGAPQPEELFAQLRRHYPGEALSAFRQPGFGVASRFPLKPLPAISGAQKARVELPTGPVTVWNVHLDKDLRGYREQVAQVRAIVADVQATAGAKIVAGDFNTTEGSVPYRMLAEALENAHEEAGIGFGFTYPGPGRRLGRLMPFLRIDHIFYSDDFYALAAGTLGDAGGSDHFPVWARLGRKRASGQAGKRASGQADKPTSDKLTSLQDGKLASGQADKLERL